jgi:Flp pilus assembly pilin Flp
MKHIRMRRIFHLSNQDGQAMVEYTIVVAAVVVGFIGFNVPMVRALNDLYDQIVTIVSLPIP